MRLFLTSMCGAGCNDIREMVEPILPWLDGVIWVFNDCPEDDPGAAWLEASKGAGRIIRRPWPARHWHSMNDTLFCGGMEEGDDFYLWSDVLEHPAPDFVARIEPEIVPMMNEADLDVIAYYGKPYLVRYRETLEYRNSPHWSLHGWNGRGIEWSTIEPDERKVRLNTRPLKRADPWHWVGHYLRYLVEYPAGSNHALLGIEQHGGDPQQAFAKREANRLAFRQEMKRRGFSRTVDGFVAMCKDPAQLDPTLKAWLRSDKVFSDAYHWLVLGNPAVRDTHRPSDALPIP